MNRQGTARQSISEKPPLLSQMIFDLIRERIISGQLKPGQHLNEIALQKELDTSRSPIREALRNLQLEGLIEVFPRRGAFVRLLSADDLNEAVEVRANLESLAAALAAERRDEPQLAALKSMLKKMKQALSKRDVARYTQVHHEFHEMLARASGNQTLARHMRLITQPFAVLRLTDLFLMRQERYAEAGHRQILKAIADRDKERAAELAELHVLALLDLPPEAMEGA